MRIPVELGVFRLLRLSVGTIQYDDEPEYPCYVPEIVGHTHDCLRNKHDWFEEGMDVCGFAEQIELLSQN